MQLSAASLDGFERHDKDAFTGYSPELAQRFYTTVKELSRQLGVEVLGLEHLPHGRALLVANHTFGFDAAFAIASISLHTGRTVWSLGEHLWWKIPFLRRAAAAFGVVDGTPANADRLLSHDELVLVLPGGLREAVKPRELRYQFLWGRRYGFVRAAIRNQAPIVPLACVGADDLFDFVGNPFERGARWLGLPQIPIPLPSRILPIPHRVQLRFIIGRPIEMHLQPEQADDIAAVRKLRREIEGALHELIENELARRAGIPL